MVTPSLPPLARAPPPQEVQKRKEAVRDLEGCRAELERLKAQGATMTRMMAEMQVRACLFACCFACLLPRLPARMPAGLRDCKICDERQRARVCTRQQ